MSDDVDDVMLDGLALARETVSATEIHQTGVEGEFSEEWWRTTKRMVERGFDMFCIKHKIKTETFEEAIRRDATAGVEMKKRKFREKLKGR